MFFLVRPHRRLVSAALLVGVVLAVSPVWSQAKDTKAPPTLIDRAEAFVDLLVAKKFSEATADFDATMLQALPAEKIAGVWTQINAQAGKYQRRTVPRQTKEGIYDVVWVPCVFERATLDTKVVFSGDGKIAGLFFLPASAPPRATQGDDGARSETQDSPFAPTPDYVDRDRFSETEVVIGEGGQWALPGTMSMPKGDGPFPAVVLLHGSGPQDRDETIGLNKPLRDIAWGLASRDIAVLRYDKRTFVHGAQMGAIANTLTVRQEVVDDATAALALVRGHIGVDASRVFVAGHSLGAMVAPRVAAKDPELAGMILLAAPARPLEDLILEQYQYIINADGTVDPNEQKQFDKIINQVAAAKSDMLQSDHPATEMPLGVPPSYWLDLRGYEPHKLAAELSTPVLVLQGERDYQVTLEDFGMWSVALAERSAATLKSYPTLNHLFIAGSGPSLPSEYQRAGTVDPEVVDDIASWIARL